MCLYHLYDETGEVKWKLEICVENEALLLKC